MNSALLCLDKIIYCCNNLDNVEIFLQFFYCRTIDVIVI